MKNIIYLDNAATTSVYKEVVKEMEKYHYVEYGNPGSEHGLGEKARTDIEKAKKVISREINCKPWEIIFTSCGTESNNLAIRGVALANPSKKKIVISCIEHSSIYEECLYLKSKGYEIYELPVNKEGFVDIVRLENEIDDNTLLVSVMHANNEIGVLQDIGAIGKICRAKNVVFHTDAVQSFCKEKIDIVKMNIDMLSASAHKIGGPKGTGFLYVRDGIKLHPIIIGGRQEAGKRAGTENVPAIMGFAKAADISKKIDKEKIKKVSKYFAEEIEKIDGKINGSKEKKISSIINASFPGKDGEMIVLTLSDKGIMCSTKSACLSKQKKDNRVLQSLFLDKRHIDGAIRFSINENIGKKDIDKVIKELKKLTK